jgi:glycosyltransferase involved in cell wall biosynthesis
MAEAKKIWYISHYTTPPLFDTHSRAIKFSQYLKESGYEVTIFSASFLHNKDIELINDRNKFLVKQYGKLKFVHIRTKQYKNNGLSRIFSLIQFSTRIFYLKRKFERPDIIIHTAYVPFENLIYYVAKKLKAKYVVEILDLWPESFVAYGMINRRNPLLKLGYMAEKWLYKKADRVIFSMAGGKDYLIDKGWSLEQGGPIDLKKINHINNGIDLEEFERNKSLYKIDDSDLENDSFFKVIYLGSIRLANNLKQLIDAAEILKDNGRIKFLIYGDGNERAALEDYCRKFEISNVIFKQKWIELKFVPYVLSKSSLNILNYMPSDILKYGGSQGKLFQYLASGKPICSNQKMGHCLIEKFDLGVSQGFKSAQEYSDAILSIEQLDKRTYDNICNRVLNVAANYDYKILTEALIKTIDIL